MLTVAAPVASDADVEVPSGGDEEQSRSTGRSSPRKAGWLLKEARVRQGHQMRMTAGDHGLRSLEKRILAVRVAIGIFHKARKSAIFPWKIKQTNTME